MQFVNNIIMLCFIEHRVIDVVFEAPDYSWDLLASFALTILFYVPAKWLARKLSLIDHPDDRKDHKQATLCAGGILIFVVFNAVFAKALFSMHRWLNNSGHWAVTVKLPIREEISLFKIIVVGALGMFVLGVLDDKYHLSSKVKLIVQLVIVVAVVVCGVRGEYFIDSAWFGGALSVLWILGVTNAFNLLDNMNGLSAGVAAIVLGALAVAMVVTGQWLIASAVIILLGAVLGFLLFNFPKGRIFLGDGGSYFIGFWIACLTVIATFYFKANDEMPRLAVCFPLLVMAVPIYDTASVVIIRLLNKKPIMQADKNHFSHRLLAMGMNPVSAVITIWLLTVAVGAGSLLLYFTTNAGSVLVLLLLACIMLVVVLLDHAGRRRKK